MVFTDFISSKSGHSGEFPTKKRVFLTVFPWSQYGSQKCPKWVKNGQNRSKSGQNGSKSGRKVTYLTYRLWGCLKTKGRWREMTPLRMSQKCSFWALLSTFEHFYVITLAERRHFGHRFSLKIGQKWLNLVKKWSKTSKLELSGGRVPET